MHAFLAEKFRETLIKSVNESGLSIPTAYYVFKDVFSDLQEAYFEQSKTPPVEETSTVDIPVNQKIEEDE